MAEIEIKEAIDPFDKELIKNLDKIKTISWTLNGKVVAKFERR